MEFKDILNEIPDIPVQFDDKLANDFASYLEKKKEKRMGAVGKITQENVTDFTKLLVEIGGVHSVLGDNSIVLKKSSEPIIVEDRDGTQVALKIFHDDRVPGDYLVLNPFKETAVLSPAHIWFETTMEQKMRVLLLRAMEEISEAIINKDDAILLQLQKIMRFGDTVPSKTIREELRKIDKDDFLYIEYTAKTKKGAIRSNLGDTNVQEGYKSKVKSKTWAFAMEMFDAIFNVSPDQFHSVFNYTSVTHGAPHCEVIIKLAYEFFVLLNPVCKILGLSTVDMSAWGEHNRYIEKYQIMTKWDDGLRQKPLKDIAVPWSPETQQVQVVAQPGQVQAPVYAHYQTPQVQQPQQQAVPVSGTGYPRATEIVANNVEAAKHAIMSPVPIMPNGMVSNMIHPGMMMPQNNMMPNMMHNMMPNGMMMPNMVQPNNMMMSMPSSIYPTQTMYPQNNMMVNPNNMMMNMQPNNMLANGMMIPPHMAAYYNQMQPQNPYAGMVKPANIG